MSGFVSSLLLFWSDLKTKVYTFVNSLRFGSFGEGGTLEAPLRLVGEAQIHVDRDVFIGSGSWLQVISGVDSDSADIEGRIQIGEGCSFSGHLTLSCVESIIIGRKVLIARYVYIADHSHAIDDADMPIIDQGISDVSPVVIGDGAWIGQGVVICPGVTIGKNAVVGANSVVNIDVPSCHVAVGAPAKIIKRGN